MNATCQGPDCNRPIDHFDLDPKGEVFRACCGQPPCCGRVATVSELAAALERLREDLHTTETRARQAEREWAKAIEERNARPPMACLTCGTAGVRFTTVGQGGDVDVRCDMCGGVDTAPIHDAVTKLVERAATFKKERDTAREDRDVIEGKLGDWTGQRCPTCKGSGEREDALSCPACGGTGDEFLNWQPRAERAEAQRDALRQALADAIHAIEEARRQGAIGMLLPEHSRPLVAAQRLLEATPPQRSPQTLVEVIATGGDPTP